MRDLGGLYVLGTERHESRRIDNQLRGRSGRQGDPGESRFYLSLEDELMRLFATGLMQRVMDKSFPDDMPLESKMVSKSIERAQGTVEDRNFEIRKDVLKYDEVMNEQRKIIYKRRQQILDGLKTCATWRSTPSTHASAARRARTVGGEFAEEWDIDGLLNEHAAVTSRSGSTRISSTRPATRGDDSRPPARRGDRDVRAARSSASAKRRCATSSVASCSP